MLERLSTRIRREPGARLAVAAAVVLAIVAGIWGFVEIADEVQEGSLQRFDEGLLRSLRRPAQPQQLRGPGWVEEVARDVTALGGVPVLVGACLAISGYFLITRKRGAALLIFVSSFGGMLLGLALKRLFARPRPEVVPHLMDVSLEAFPSGHSLMSAVVYLTLGLLAAEWAPGVLAKVYVFLLAALLTGAIGVSRVLLGVHYPTDVMAGWCVGLSWALLCWLVAKALEHRHLVESPEPE